MNSCWKLLVFMLNNLGNNIEEIRNKAQKEPAKVEKQMIENTKMFLEKQYSEYVKNVLLSNGISRGGNPNEHKTISHFADFVVKNRSGVKKRDSNYAPFWPVVYYLLREGEKSQANSIIQESDVEEVIKTQFLAYSSSKSDFLFLFFVFIFIFYFYLFFYFYFIFIFILFIIIIFLFLIIIYLYFNYFYLFIFYYFFLFFFFKTK